MLSDTAKLYTELHLKDGLSSGLKKARGVLRDYHGQTVTVGQGLKNLQNNLTRIAKFGFLAVAGAATYAIKQAGDFQAQLNTINTVAKVNESALGRIGAGIRQMARDTGASTSDLTASYYDLLSAGIKAADAQNVLTQANHLAIGGLSTNTEAVNVLTTAINAYGGDASKAKEYTDQLAMAINLGKVKASEIAASFANVALIASKYSIGVNEIAAAYATLTAKGMAAGDVTTYMRQTINSLIKPTSALKALEKQTGKSYIAIAGKKGLVVALQMMVDDAKKAGIDVATLTGRIQAQQFIAGTTGASLQSYLDALNKVNNASKDGGEAMKQFQIRQQGLNYSLDRLKAVARDTAITFGMDLLPSVKNVSDALYNLLVTHRSDIETFSHKIGDLANTLFSTPNVESGVQKALTFLKDLPWADIKAEMKFSADIAKKAIDLFNGLPPELQKGIVLFYAGNKLTGGALGSLAGTILDWAGLKTIHAANVTVIGANVTGGVPGATGGTGGGSGGLLGWIKTIIPIAAVAVMGDQSIQAIQAALDRNNAYAAQGLTQAEINALLLSKPLTPGERRTVVPENWDPVTRAKNLQSALDKIAANTSGLPSLLPNAAPTTIPNDPASRPPTGDDIHRMVREQVRMTQFTVEQNQKLSTADRVMQLLYASSQAANIGDAQRARQLQAKAERIARAAGTTTQAVRDKKLSVTVNNTVRTTVSVSAVAIVAAAERVVLGHKVGFQ